MTNAHRDDGDRDRDRECKSEALLLSLADSPCFGRALASSCLHQCRLFHALAWSPLESLAPMYLMGTAPLLTIVVLGRPGHFGDITMKSPSASTRTRRYRRKKTTVGGRRMTGDSRTSFQKLSSVTVLRSFLHRRARALPLRARPPLPVVRPLSYIPDSHNSAHAHLAVTELSPFALLICQDTGRAGTRFSLVI